MRSARVTGILVAAALALPLRAVRANAPVGVDLLVTDARGRVVTDLTAAEVEVHEDGVPRGIAALRLADLDEPRTFGVFLDDYHVDAASSARVRAAMAAFLERELSPGDQVAVLKPLDSLVDIRFSGDRAAAAAAVAAFEGRRGDYRARTPFEKNFVARSPAIVERTRAQVSWSALAALADALGRSGEGRKTLVVVSEGIGPPAAARGPRAAGRESVARLANRGRVAVYAIDPSADPAPAADGTETPARALAALADETNGRAVRGDVEAGLRAAVADARQYYWLSYDPSHDDDGRFHQVTISVSRPQATVRARPGYWARSDAIDRLIAAASAPPEPLPIGEAYHVSPLITPWFGFARGPNGETRVTFVWEPAARVPGLRRNAAAPEASRLVVEVLDADDTPIFEGEVAPAIPGQEAAAGPAARAVFDAPPGRLRLRMSVRGGPAGDELDRDVRAITVRALDGAVTMGSAEVVRTFTGLDWRRLVDDPAAAPSASREFRRTERLLIRFPVYADGPIAARAQLLGPNGRPLRDLDVGAGPRGEGTFQIDLPLASFAQGDYAVEIVASAAAGEARDLLHFRVTY